MNAGPRAPFSATSPQSPSGEHLKRAAARLALANSGRFGARLFRSLAGASPLPGSLGVVPRVSLPYVLPEHRQQAGRPAVVRKSRAGTQPLATPGISNYRRLN